MIKKFFAGCIIAACVASASAQWAPQSKIVTDSIKSEALNGAWRQFNVYIPASFDANPTKTYPILYLLHGVLDTNRGWTERGHLKDVMDQLVASGEAEEMIIVTPNAGGDIAAGAWNGYFNMPGWNYEDFFFNEFMPYIEKTYRVKGDKTHRAIAGLSMGGGGTTSYAQRHPDMFGAVYAMSALMDVPEVPGQPAIDINATDKWSILHRAVKEKSCIDYVKNADDETKAKLRTLQWFVDCGDDDFLLQRNIEFMQAMRDAWIPMQFRVRDGGHTWEYWHSALYNALPFVSRYFLKANQAE